MLLMYVLSVLLVIYYAVNRYRRRKFYHLMKVTGHQITSVPILGIAHHLLGNNQSRMKALQYFGLEANRIGGVAAGWLGPLPYIVISDAVAAEVVLRECLDKDYVMKIVRDVIGNGLIVAPLSIWRTRRRVLVPTFISKNLKEFMRIFYKQNLIMVEQLRKNVGKGPFPIWNYLASNNLDTVCEAVFGVQMHVQKNPKHPFLTSFNDVSSIMAARLCQPWIHSSSVFRLLPQYQEMKKHRQVLYDIVDEIIKKKLKDMEDSKNNKNKDIGMRPFLELLMESSAQDSGPYNHKELREETLTLTIAGTDTSAAAIAFVLQAFSKYHDVQDKIYQEIMDVFGDEEECTMENLKKLVYMEAAIKEAMRLYTPVPVVLRRVSHDVTLPSGLTLPAGCGILMNIWALHRNQKYWGADAEEFKPERFFQPFKHPAQYMAFSYGPRGCPGIRYAMLSMKSALATILRHYRVLPVTGEPRLSFELMMKDADDFRVEIELRNSTQVLK